MKKILTFFLLIVFLAKMSPAQTKVIFSLDNRKVSGGILAYMVKATVPTGQTWHVGSCNIRLTFSGNPTGCLSVHADNPADSANSNLSGGIYQAMTTTSVGGGVAIGLNILTLSTNGFYTFGPGTYNLGRIRFNYTVPFNADTTMFRVPPVQYASVVYDSLTPLAYLTGYLISQGTVTSETGITSFLPSEYKLYQNYPNPFNPTTTIKYDVPKTSYIKIKIYDVTGKLISELVNGEIGAGSYEVNWNAAEYASGIYFYRYESKEYTKVMRMVLIK
jgi:hypothetical protein